MCCKQQCGEDYNVIKEHPVYFKEERENISILYNAIKKQRCNQWKDSFYKLRLIISNPYLISPWYEHIA